MWTAKTQHSTGIDYHMAGLCLKFCYHIRRMLVPIMGFLAAMVVLSQFWVLPFSRVMPTLLPGEEASPFVMIKSPPSRNLVVNSNFNIVEGVGLNTSEVIEDGKGSGLTFDHERSEQDVASAMDLSAMRKSGSVENGLSILLKDSDIGDNVEDVYNLDVSKNYSTVFGRISKDTLEPLISSSVVSSTTSSSQMHKMKQILEFKNESSVIERYVQKMRGPTISFSEMKSMLLNRHSPAISVRRRRSTRTTTRDRQLVSANQQIRNAPVLRNLIDLHAPLYCNASVFKKSYDLMEHLLKVYVYKEGEKPIFHHPRLRGLYAAEGWFMKLMERSKHFAVRDLRKAHLYYMPFSSGTLRTTLYAKKPSSIKGLENYLTNYVDLIKTRYPFWNRTGGADHFFVACHDWGSRITRNILSSCVRGLCNANAARGFGVGKDVSVPVTYVRSGKDPTRDIGGKSPLERKILAFFAGQVHGYLRPLLLQYWENKAPDMKILGPMQRDVEGKAVYRDYMKSSKYCICARGYEVHTPRVVESIFYECIPVIISDNYVPPFFELLDWEAFSVFVQEKDIPNLRNILLSIPEERYLEMQHNLRMVQRHFIWHEIPEKYDLFHMILHSVWYNRVSQIRPA